jgi:hypothetical protein
MAQNTSNDINYFLAIDEKHLDFLGKIRHWANLKMAMEDNFCWVKDFTYEQINALEVKTIPYKTIYYSQENKLFKQDSLLPERTIPMLLWTPIERALSIELPSYNFNYFGVNDQVSVKLVQSEQEKPVFGMLVDRRVLEEYIQNAPAIRLQKLKWTILDESAVFIIGEPNLPIQGEGFWKNGDFFLPIGYDFELPILTNVLSQLIDPNHRNYIVYGLDNQYFLMGKHDFQPLSISSFRLSFYNL